MPKKPQPGKKFKSDEFFAKFLVLLARHSPESLSYSKISKWTGVSRSTLYYYFGSNLETLMREAVTAGSRTFVQMSTIQSHRNFKDFESFQRMVIVESHKMVEKFPWAPILYLRYRQDPGKIGDAAREVEKAYIGEQVRAWKHFYGKDPDPVRFRVQAYVKLGILYGLQTDAGVWFGEKNTAQREWLAEETLRFVQGILK